MHQILSALFFTTLLTSISSCFCSYPLDHGYDDLFFSSNDGTMLRNHGFREKTRDLHVPGSYKYRENVRPMKYHRRHGNAPKSSPQVFNVDDFGARANGADDSHAFKKAWDAACSSSTRTVFYVVPRNRVYHLKPVKFSGPCRSQVLVFKVYGTLKASRNPSDYERDRRHWIVFDTVHNLRVEGGGRIDGNGKIWWQKSCKINPSLPCKEAPTAVTFTACKNLMVRQIRLQNAQQMHISFQDCENVKAVGLSVASPGNSPNTDGIHVSGTKNILISDSVVRTGDDCISIVSGSENVRATGITCGPGHGISIGSLGKGNSEAYVSNVVVNKATIIGATNGVRIKTWQGGRGYAKNIVFQDVVMKNVTNPIIIDQNYCDRDGSCPEQTSAVQVSNVVYRNIQGTSSTPTAVKFDCSKSIPCRGVSMQNVKLRGQSEEISKASCSNVNLNTRGEVFPSCT
ncbi:PREDICTED: polygalacturonase QRT2-like [Tarenaya hassleriana]|uniref:polygalacturonase QRT2-like n=1 Tax=Tarenaya hassleriana TaxID=28532 RepID=UPI00053C3726|nr:PREDICTED: polygalacturonase QRT2-like [Tarenaya hassleriana]